jgi:uncharacterized protein YcnI
MQAHMIVWRRMLVASAATLAASGVLAAQASAHAEVSPPVAQKGSAEVFTLAVPTEEDNATTTSIELTVPANFGIDSFEAEPGWKRSVQSTGSGESAVVQKVTWTGGKTPTGEDSIFRFLATATKTGDFTFQVRQTYSNGKVVDWSGPESSDTPAPVVKAVSSLGGGGGSSNTLGVIALIVGALALVLALVGMLGRGGGRELT